MKFEASIYWKARNSLETFQTEYDLDVLKTCWSHSTENIRALDSRYSASNSFFFVHVYQMLTQPIANSAEHSKSFSIISASLTQRIFVTHGQRPAEGQTSGDK